MKIVLLESLGVSDAVLEGFASQFTAKGHSFSAYERTADEAALISEAQDADVIMIANMPLSGNVIRACRNLKFIDVAFTGVDHVDLEAAKEMGVSVSNASGYSNESVAELVIGQMIALLRRIPQTEDRCRNNGTMTGLIGREIAGCTVGVVGTGAIGYRVAELCRYMGANVLGYDPKPNPKGEAVLTYASLEEVLRNSDVVTLHCPLMSSTTGLIGERELRSMKPSAYLINMARGPVVDIPALAKALEDGTIAGAAVDVFEKEPPLPQDHPLLRAPNCHVTPHIAFASRESMEKRARIVFDSLAQWMAGNQIHKIL